MKDNLASSKKELEEIIQANELEEQTDKKPTGEHQLDDLDLSPRERRRRMFQEEKEKISELSFWRKVQYFLNYYAMKYIWTAIGIVAAILIVRQIYLITRPVALDLVLVNDVTNTTIETVVPELYRAHYEVEDDAVFNVDSNFELDPDAEYVTDMTYYNKLMSSITSNTTEIIICDAGVVDYYAIDGYLLKLPYNLTEDQVNAIQDQNRFYETMGLSGEDEHSPDYYAIDLTGTKFVKAAGIGLEQPYLCIPCTLDEEHLTIAQQFVQMVLDMENE